MNSVSQDGGLHNNGNELAANRTPRRNRQSMLFCVEIESLLMSVHLKVFSADLSVLVPIRPRPPAFSGPPCQWT